MSEVKETLKERGAAYGPNWNKYAEIRRALETNDMKWTNRQRYCLDMIAMKLSRLVAGDQNKADTWHDIAGYATLAEEEITNAVGQGKNNE